MWQFPRSYLERWPFIWYQLLFLETFFWSHIQNWGNDYIDKTHDNLPNSFPNTPPTLLPNPPSKSAGAAKGWTSLRPNWGGTWRKRSFLLTILNFRFVTLVKMILTTSLTPRTWCPATAWSTSTSLSTSGHNRPGRGPCRVSRREEVWQRWKILLQMGLLRHPASGFNPGGCEPTRTSSKGDWEEIKKGKKKHFLGEEGATLAFWEGEVRGRRQGRDSQCWKERTPGRAAPTGWKTALVRSGRVIFIFQPMDQGGHAIRSRGQVQEHQRLDRVGRQSRNSGIFFRPFLIIIEDNKIWRCEIFSLLIYLKTKSSNLLSLVQSSVCRSWDSYFSSVFLLCRVFSAVNKSWCSCCQWLGWANQLWPPGDRQTNWLWPTRWKHVRIWKMRGV